MQYDHRKIEAKWQKYWATHQSFKTYDTSSKPKYYILDMFPYPSGAGLHVGHPLGYIASDIYARYRRHCGYNVLHPMGYDSFGLPAEQYAIQTGQHPSITTKKNINRYRSQLDRMGFSFDWSREIRTSDPEYYKWTQWIFTELFASWYDCLSDCAKPIIELLNIFEKEGNLQVQAACDEHTESFSSTQWQSFSNKKQQNILLKYRLTYLSETEVNWCPTLMTVLANDEIIGGLSERGGHPVVRKKMTQWSMRITAYAQRLLDGLKQVDWSESIKEAQRHWIGRSVGAKVCFDIENRNRQITIFTTRVDTLFGVSFLTVAPEFDGLSELISDEQQTAVITYIEHVAQRSERERMADQKSISGVFTGTYAIHPLSGRRLPIWVGDYVLGSYGTGAVMAVPCGDSRDYNFAKYFDLPIINIFKGVDISVQSYSDKSNICLKNSGAFDGFNHEEATTRITEALQAKSYGKATINYRLRDAVFSRQRYWGEPFPVYYKDGIPQMIDVKYLPIHLPKVEHYLPTPTGKPPLGNANRWAWDTKQHKVVANDAIDHKKVFPLELNTMPGWAGSSWYFNRYMDSNNTDRFVSNKAISYWRDIDLYIGGNEHATGHLLYSRFWQKFLFDRGYLPTDEYAKKLINQGMILGESAIIYRDQHKPIFYSKNKKKGQQVIPIHIDVSIVNQSNILDVEKYKTQSKEYVSFEFVNEDDGEFVVHREVEKMSKSKYNVINPDDICNQYGADTLRLYEMFLGPLEQSKPWSTAGISGVHSFLKKLWKLYYNNQQWLVDDTTPSMKSLKTLHRTIKKITDDINNFSFNTSVSAFMIAVNEFTIQDCHSRDVLSPLLILLSPFTPHIAEELWQQLGHKESISTVSFPKYNSQYLIEKTNEYPVSFNGKVRFKVSYPSDNNIKDIEKTILEHPKTINYLEGKPPKKIIVVLGKIINIVN